MFQAIDYVYMCKVTILGNQSGTWGPKIQIRMCDLVLLEMLSMNPQLHKNYKDKKSSYDFADIIALIN